jgi:hypothetical protein
MPKLPPSPQQLLVEGKTDQHVVWALCKKYNVPENFSVVQPPIEDGEGIGALFEGLPVRLKISGLQTLGLVVDADFEPGLAGRWNSIRDRLIQSGYVRIPSSLPPEGLIYAPAGLPKIGVWLMPDNQTSGVLEDFAATLIPPDDDLFPIAESVLRSIEDKSLCRYSAVHRPKALIHTWLAWQRKPGIPIGQAITANLLKYNSTIVNAFIEWLTELFK